MLVGYYNSEIVLRELIIWLGRCNFSKFQKQVIAATWASMVYYIWGARNEVYWNSKVLFVNIIVHIEYKGW